MCIGLKPQINIFDGIRFYSLSPRSSLNTTKHWILVAALIWPNVLNITLDVFIDYHAASTHRKIILAEEAKDFSYVFQAGLSPCV
ncbi:Uncharacterised protein [Klebsiella pneumoniae]|nr:Uncharacterised protein [Klebsiella pneumoniae]